MGVLGRPFLVALIQTLLGILQIRAILMFEKSDSWEHMKLFSQPGMLEKKCDLLKLSESVTSYLVE